MKKLGFLLLIAAFMTTACSKEEVVTNLEQETTEVSQNTTNESSTTPNKGENVVEITSTFCTYCQYWDGQDCGTCTSDCDCSAPIDIIGSVVSNAANELEVAINDDEVHEFFAADNESTYELLFPDICGVLLSDLQDQTTTLKIVEFNSSTAQYRVIDKSTGVNPNYSSSELDCE